ncbi:MAG: hypothetical protein AAF530_19990 [Pseudomonadota bacterium]
MRFKTRGTFQTEAILEVAQRVMAQIQDAGVDHISGFNIYLTPTDAAGKHRRFVKDGLEIDHVDVETWDLAIVEPESEMTTVYADERANTAAPRAGQKPQSYNGRRRRQTR